MLLDILNSSYKLKLILCISNILELIKIDIKCQYGKLNQTVIDEFYGIHSFKSIAILRSLRNAYVHDISNVRMLLLYTSQLKPEHVYDYFRYFNLSYTVSDIAELIESTNRHLQSAEMQEVCIYGGRIYSISDLCRGFGVNYDNISGVELSDLLRSKLAEKDKLSHSKLKTTESAVSVLDTMFGS